MLSCEQLTKRYGPAVAVHDLTCTVRPGVVTGFLGPNGAGKSTTMRLLLGLDRPDSGRALVGGRPYRSLRQPLRQVGALLDARAVQGGRSARGHLLWLARSHRIPARRVDEVLGQVGLQDVAHRPCRSFSLGMSQRLGLAAALLGEPEILLLDEPVNGLDPEGVRWLRDLLRGLAAEGRTVLLSSHLMSEMQITADHLLVIGRGRLLADCSMAEFTERFCGRSVLISTGEPARLASVLRQAGLPIRDQGDGCLVSDSTDAAAIGRVAAQAGVPLDSLSTVATSLEDAFLRMTEDSAQFRSGGVRRPMAEWDRAG